MWKPGATAWHVAGSAHVLRLDYTRSTDVSGVSLSTGVYTDVIGDQSFTVGNSGSLVEFTVRGMATIGTGAGPIAMYVYVDGTTRYYLSASQVQVGGNYGGIPISGTRYISGLSAGAHTARIQAIATQAETMYVRAASLGTQEALAIQIVEWL